MIIVERQRFNALIRKMFPAGIDNILQILLMHYFISFQIERPIAGTVELCNHFLLTVHITADPHLVVPVRLDNPYLRITDLLDYLESFIITVTNVDDEFIDNRQHGTN